MRLSFVFRDRDRDWYYLSLNFETESETEINLKTQSKTKNFGVLIPRWSLMHEVPASQILGMVGDHNFVCVLIKIKSETRFF